MLESKQLQPPPCVEHDFPGDLDPIALKQSPSVDEVFQPPRGKILSSRTFTYSTIFGHVKCVTVFREAYRDARLVPTRSGADLAVQTETTILFSPVFIRRVIHWRRVVLYGQVQRQWKVYVLDEDSVLWQLCEMGDLIGVQQALSQGASPYILRRDQHKLFFNEEHEENLLEVRRSASNALIGLMG